MGEDHVDGDFDHDGDEKKEGGEGAPQNSSLLSVVYLTSPSREKKYI